MQISSIIHMETDSKVIAPNKSKSYFLHLSPSSDAKSFQYTENDLSLNCIHFK